MVICCKAWATSDGVGKYTGGMAWVIEVAPYQSKASAANVAAPTASLKAADLPSPIGRPSVAVVGERLELRVPIDHAHVLVGDVRRSRRRFRDRARALHELADLGQPLVDVGGSGRAIHDLQVP